MKARIGKIAEYASFILPLYLLFACGLIFLLGRVDLRHCTDILFYPPIILAGLYCSRRYLILMSTSVGIIYTVIFLTNTLPTQSYYTTEALIFEVTIRIFFLSISGYLSFFYAQEQRKSRDSLKEVISERNQHIRQLQLHLNINGALSKNLHLGARLEELLTIWLSYIKAESGSVLLCDGKEDKMVLAAARGSQELYEAMGTKRKGEGIAGCVAQTGEPLLLTRGTDGLGTGGVQNAICAPLLTKEGVIGVIAVCNKLNKDSFNQLDLDLLVSIANQATAYVQNVNLYTEIKELSMNVIATLIQAIEAKDRYTRGHSAQVNALALKVGRDLNLSKGELELLQTAALLHDVGKIGISEAILNKKGTLTKDEYEQVKQHPAIGAAILKPIKGLEEVTMAVYHHHERYDGRGYLDGLKEKDIPQTARIIAVCDSYAAMTSDRPHRKALSGEQAIDELERVKGKQLDPTVVDSLVRIIKLSLHGSRKSKVTADV